MTLGCLNFKKFILRNYADHAETVSSKLVEFRKTPFHDPVRYKKAALAEGFLQVLE